MSGVSKGEKYKLNVSRKKEILLKGGREGEVELKERQKGDRLKEGDR